MERNTEEEKEILKRQIYIYDNIINTAVDLRAKNQLLQDQVIISLASIFAGVFIFIFDKLNLKLYQQLILGILTLVCIATIICVLISIFLSIKEHNFAEKFAEYRIYYPDKYKRLLKADKYNKKNRPKRLRADFYNKYSFCLTIVFLIGIMFFLITIGITKAIKCI